MVILDRIPVEIRAEDAVWCEECRMITEAKYSDGECNYCKSKAIVPLLDILNPKPMPCY